MTYATAAKGLWKWFLWLGLILVAYVLSLGPGIRISGMLPGPGQKTLRIVYVPLAIAEIYLPVLLQDSLEAYVEVWNPGVFPHKRRPLVAARRKKEKAPDPFQPGA